MLEPQRTNLFQYSNDFNQWTTSGTITSGQDGLGVNPDAWIYQNSTPTSAVYISNTLSGAQTMSGFFKKNSTNGIRLFAFGDVNCSAYFDLNNGTVDLQQNVISADIVPFGDDWFRCSITFNQTNTQCSVYITNNANTQVLGEITMQYMQLELGSYPTSYIPTNGATATRNGEFASNSNILSSMGQTEGTIFIDVISAEKDTEILSFNRSSQNAFFLYTNASNNYRVSSYLDGTVRANTLISGNQRIKIAIAYEDNNQRLYVNGVLIQTYTDSWTPNQSMYRIFFNQGGYVAAKGKSNISALQVFKTSLTDAQLQTLTTI